LVTEFYHFTSHNNDKLYIFQSVGVQGEITKMVRFTLIGKNRYNLGLADFVNGKMVYDRDSNNFDVLKVLSTVSEVINHFTLEHREREVVIMALERKRLAIYNAIFKRRYEEVSAAFWVWGIKDDNTEEIFNPTKHYNGFIVKRK
jgi:hypothetical protein